MVAHSKLISKKKWKAVFALICLNKMEKKQERIGVLLWITTHTLWFLRIIYGKDAQERRAAGTGLLPSCCFNCPVCAKNRNHERVTILGQNLENTEPRNTWTGPEDARRKSIAVTCRPDIWWPSLPHSVYILYEAQYSYSSCNMLFLC